MGRIGLIGKVCSVGSGARLEFCGGDESWAEMGKGRLVFGMVVGPTIGVEKGKTSSLNKTSRLVNIF